MNEEGLVTRAVESAGPRQENTGQANSAVHGCSWLLSAPCFSLRGVGCLAINAKATVEDRMVLCIVLARRVLHVCSSKASGSVMKATAGVSIQHVLYKFLVMFASGLLF